MTVSVVVGKQLFGFLERRKGRIVNCKTNEGIMTLRKVSTEGTRVYEENTEDETISLKEKIKESLSVDTRG